MENKNINKQKTLGLSLGLCGAVCVWSFLCYISSTMGIIGLLKNEILAVIIVSVIALLGGICLTMACLKNKVVKKISLVFSCLLTVAGLIGNVLLFSFQFKSPKGEIGLNFYSSSSPKINQEKRLNLAVASDGHWGWEKSNAEARTQILKDIGGGNYDLFTFGGDLVDMAFMPGQFEEAIADLEKYCGNVPMAFVMGNHDVMVNSQLPFRKYFQPKESSFNFVLNPATDVYIVCFNLLWGMEDVSRESLIWLEKVLSGFSPNDVVIFQAHAFAFASGEVSSGLGKWFDNPQVIEKIVPLLEKYKVGLMVSGHQHSMELMENNGVHYALVGPSGGSLCHDYKVKTRANQIYYNGDTYGYVQIQIEQNSLTLTFKNQIGENLFAKTIEV